VYTSQYRASIVGNDTQSDENRAVFRSKSLKIMRGLDINGDIETMTGRGSTCRIRFNASLHD